SDDKFKLFCWILTKSAMPFSVKIEKGETVDDLKKAIKKMPWLASTPTGSIYGR
ncbi:hypothetical protein L208DRAFT_1317770, partial [Tricholoma matsutake]